MKKLGLTIVFSLLIGSYAFAQWGDEEMNEKPSLRERLFFGGGLGGSFSSYYTYISVSPIVGYKITPKLAGGLQLTYRYTNYKGTPSYSTNDYGIGPFVRFSVYGPFFLHAEYEYLNYEFPITSTKSVRKDFNSVMAGGGLFQPIGRRAGFFLMALYNFSYEQSNSPSDYTPYDSPLIIRAGITAGF